MSPKSGQDTCVTGIKDFIRADLLRTGKCFRIIAHTLLNAGWSSK